MKAAAIIAVAIVVLAGLAALIEKGYQKVETRLKIRVASEKEELEKDSVVMAVGDTPVTYQELMVYVYQIKAMYSDKMGEKIWDIKTDGENTLEDYAHEQIMEQMLQVKICCEEARKEEVTLETEEKEEARRLAEAMLNEASEEDKKNYFLEKKVAQKVFEENLLAGKLYDKTVGDVDTVINEGVDAEDAAQKIQNEQDRTFREAYGEWQKKVKIVVSKNLWKQVGGRL